MTHCRLSALHLFRDKPPLPAKTAKLPPAAIPSAMNLALTALRTRSIGPAAGDLKPPNPRSRPATPKPGATPRDDHRPPKNALFRFGGARASADLDDEVGLLERRPSERTSRQSEVSVVEEAPRGRRISGAESEREYWDRAAQEPLEALGELYHLDSEVGVFRRSNCFFPVAQANPM